MTNDEVVLDAARAIRGDMPDLLGSTGEESSLGARLDAELAALLAAADRGADVTGEILHRLNGLPVTQAWTLAFLTYGVPPDLAVPAVTRPLLACLLAVVARRARESRSVQLSTVARWAATQSGSDVRLVSGCRPVEHMAGCFRRR